MYMLFMTTCPILHGRYGGQFGQLIPLTDVHDDLCAVVQLFHTIPSHRPSVLSLESWPSKVLLVSAVSPPLVKDVCQCRCQLEAEYQQ